MKEVPFLVSNPKIPFSSSPHYLSCHAQPLRFIITAVVFQVVVYIVVSRHMAYTTRNTTVITME